VFGDLHGSLNPEDGGNWYAPVEFVLSGGGRPQAVSAKVDVVLLDHIYAISAGFSCVEDRISWRLMKLVQFTTCNVRHDWRGGTACLPA
jgi:hypothetical protein